MHIITDNAPVGPNMMKNHQPRDSSAHQPEQKQTQGGGDEFEKTKRKLGRGNVISRAEFLTL